MSGKQSDFEYRKVMWLFLSDIFEDEDDKEFAFVWLFSEADQLEASMSSDGFLTLGGYYKGIADDS